MNIKCIFTDLDGTLLDTEKKPGIKSIEMLKKLKQQGLHLGIATGRSVDIVLNLLKEWGLNNQIDWIIGMNGAQLYNMERHTLYRQHLLTANQLTQLTAMLYRFDVNLYLYDCLTQKALLRRQDALGQYIVHINRSEYEIVDLRKLSKDYEKLLVLAEPSLLSDIQEQLNGCKGLSAMRTLPVCIEIVSQDNSKANAVKQVCAYENIDLSEVMAFGDEENDIEMIAECGMGVAMLNGNAELKQSADTCTAFTNNEDGVGEFLYQYFIREKEV